MPIDFESEPLGRQIGIEEHQRKIAMLVREEIEILREAEDGSDPDQIRLDEIADEIAYRKIQINRLRGDGPSTASTP